MHDDYLWDRTGEPDPEIVKLEKLLSIYSARCKRTRPRAVAFLAAAACLILLASAALWLERKSASEWQIAGKQVNIGQTIETGAAGNAKLEAKFVGEIKLDANSRLQVLPSDDRNVRLALRRGTMHAWIWAPPARFVVDTPSAKTIDLGCSYTLTVLPDDSGLLRVETGWVAFQADALESFIPAGAVCHTRPRAGPGLPYFEDAPDALRDAVVKFDATAGREDLDAILASARKRDALTVWHLLVRTSGADRDLVIQRFASLVPEADSGLISALRAGKSAAFDEAWTLLGLGGAEWWRMWKHHW